MRHSRPPVITPGERRALDPIRALLPCGGRPPQRRWAVASGCGGVGRSTVALVLARRLVRRGQRICLVDADWSSPALATMAGLADGPLHSPWRGAALQPVATPEHDELLLVAGAPPLRGDPSRRAGHALGNRISELDVDATVLDLPAGTTELGLDLWLTADAPLLVTVPERTPLEGTSRFLVRVFTRLVEPWLARKLGAAAARDLMEEAWRDCGGRTGTWLRRLASRSGTPEGDLREQAARKRLYLALNRIRRGDDLDIGHALVTAAGHGLGLDLHFRAAIPFDDDGWIRARRTGVPADGDGALMGIELDEMLDRMAADTDVPPPGTWKWTLLEAAALAGGVAGS